MAKAAEKISADQSATFFLLVIALGGVQLAFGGLLWWLKRSFTQMIDHMHNRQQHLDPAHGYVTDTDCKERRDGADAQCKEHRDAYSQAIRDLSAQMHRDLQALSDSMTAVHGRVDEQYKTIIHELAQIQH